MRTVYVIDTSFLMEYPDIVRKLGEEYGAHIYIHNASLFELEAIKNDKNRQKTPEQRSKAGDALREINRTAKTSQEGAYILNKEKDSYFYINNSIAEHDGMASKGDRRFLGLISELKKKYAQSDEVVALVIDNSAELQAKQLGAWTISRYKFEPWDILRVQPHATKEELKSAKRNLLQRYHYDKTVSNTNMTAIEKKYAEEKTREINGIFENFEKSNYQKYWLDSEYKHTYKGNGNGGSYSSSSASNNSETSGYSGSHGSYSDEEFQREFERLKKKFRDADHARSSSGASSYSGSSSGTSGYSSGASSYSSSNRASRYNNYSRISKAIRNFLASLIISILALLPFMLLGFSFLWEEHIRKTYQETTTETKQQRLERNTSERANKRRAENARRTQEARQERAAAPVKEEKTEPVKETEPQRSENEEKKEELDTKDLERLKTFVLNKAGTFPGFMQMPRGDRAIRRVIMKHVILTLNYKPEDVYNKHVNFLKQRNFVIHSEGSGQVTQSMLDYRNFTYRLWYPARGRATGIGFSDHAYRIKEEGIRKHCIAVLVLEEQKGEEIEGVIAVNLQIIQLSPIQVGVIPETSPILIVYYVVSKSSYDWPGGIAFSEYNTKTTTSIRMFLENFKAEGRENRVTSIWPRSI
jgi:curved DNA-binding protein CbpA